MSYIIIIKNPRTKKHLVIREDEESDYVMEYETEDEALDATRKMPICNAWSYDIIEIE